MPIIHSYIPQEKQLAFHKSPKRYRYFHGAFGAGKTRTLVEEAIDLCMRSPNNFGLLCRKFREDCKDTIMKEFQEACDPSLYTSKEGGWRVEFTNGSTLVFSGLYTRSKIRISKVMSYNLGFAGVDQAEEITEEDFLMLGRRCRRHNVDRRCMILAANPPPMDHWLYKYFVENINGQGDALSNPEDYQIISTSSYDNKYLPADYIKSLENLPENWKRRFLYGEFGFLLYGFPVFKSFDEDRHIKEIEADSELPIYRGWDFGWVRPAVIFLQINKDCQLRVLREFTREKTYLEDFAPQATKFTNDNFHDFKILDYCDVAGKQHNDASKKTSIEILKNFGIKAKSRKLEILAGIEMIEKKMCEVKNSEESFLVHPDCRYLIEGYQGGYHYAKKSDGRVEPTPCKDGIYDHFQDGVRYILGNVFSGISGASMKTRAHANINIAEPSWNFGGVI